MPPKRELTLRWIRTWEEAGPELERIKAEELRQMTEAHALSMADAVLDIASAGWHNPARESWSGLVEQQALLHRPPSK